VPGIAFKLRFLHRFLAMAASSCENSFASTGATCSCTPASFAVQAAPPTCASGELISACTTPFANCSTTASAMVMNGGSADDYLTAYCECYSYYLVWYVDMLLLVRVWC
jgi:hypothetical protein